MDRMNPSPPAARVSTATILLLAASCGLIVANIYYAQPLIGPIAASLGLAPHAAGLIVTMTQIGYAAGLVFSCARRSRRKPENRHCLRSAERNRGGLALASSSAAFLASAFAIGLGSAAVQIIVPLAAHLAPDAVRGRVVGAVMSGLMIGIMASRPVASFIASETSWRVVFAASAHLMVALGLVLSRTLPVRKPQARMSYGALIASMGRRAATPILRLRAFYQSCLFAAFSLFWTTTPLLLAGPDYRLAQRGIALFGLAGVSGAVAAPIAGRLADRGFSRPATGAAITLVALAFIATMVTKQGSTLALGVLVGAAVAVDFGVQANVVLGLRAIFGARAGSARPPNGIYIATFFAAGALGSAIGAWAYAEGGWTLASRIGLALPLIALARFVFRLATGRGRRPLPPH